MLGTRELPPDIYKEIFPENIPLKKLFGPINPYEQQPSPELLRELQPIVFLHGLGASYGTRHLFPDIAAIIPPGYFAYHVALANQIARDFPIGIIPLTEQAKRVKEVSIVIQEAHGQKGITYITHSMGGLIPGLMDTLPNGSRVILLAPSLRSDHAKIFLSKHNLSVGGNDIIPIPNGGNLVFSATAINEIYRLDSLQVTINLLKRQGLESVKIFLAGADKMIENPDPLDDDLKKITTTIGGADHYFYPDESRASLVAAIQAELSNNITQP